MKKFISQNYRLNPRSTKCCESDSLTEVATVYRTACHHHILRKNKILDGVTSSTGLWDTSEGEVPEVFDYHVDRMDLADSLLRRGDSLKDATKVAQSSHTSTTVSVEN